MFKVVKFQPVEVRIPLNFSGSSISFDNQASLYNKFVQGIEVFVKELMPYSPVSQENTIETVDLNLCSFEFFRGSEQVCNRLPAQKLNRSIYNNVFSNLQSSFNNDFFLVEDWQISWDKCNLYVAKASELTVTDVIITLGIYYTDMPVGVRRPI